MGRAIVREPRVFLMDEPLSNLDAKLRVATRSEIAALQRRLGVTTVYVTHDQVEAMTMGDRDAVMKDGVLQQCDTPARAVRQILSTPLSPRVHRITTDEPGHRNNHAGRSHRGISVGSRPATSCRLRPLARQPLLVGLRPESLELSGPGDGIPAVVTLVEELGAEAFVHASID